MMNHRQQTKAARRQPQSSNANKQISPAHEKKKPLVKTKQAAPVGALHKCPECSWTTSAGLMALVAHRRRHSTANKNRQRGSQVEGFDAATGKFVCPRCARGFQYPTAFRKHTEACNPLPQNRRGQRKRSAVSSQVAAVERQLEQGELLLDGLQQKPRQQQQQPKQLFTFGSGSPSPAPPPPAPAARPRERGRQQAKHTAPLRQPRQNDSARRASPAGRYLEPATCWFHVPVTGRLAPCKQLESVLFGTGGGGGHIAGAGAKPSVNTATTNPEDQTSSPISPTPAPTPPSAEHLSTVAQFRDLFQRVGAEQAADLIYFT